MNLSSIDVEDILRAEDIEGFIALGAPQDEYSNEAEQISKNINQSSKKKSEQELFSIIQNIWEKSFGPFSSEDIGKRLPAFRKLAEKIFFIVK